MAIKYLDGKRLAKLLRAGSKWLLKHQEVLNDLNVYPVPDGDTGTNMALTLGEIENILREEDDELEISEIAELVSSNILLNARGNSGTILSQILSGILLGLKGKKKIYVKDIAIALENAKNMAYKAVNNPVEGTMLTVIRRIAEEASELAKTEEYLDEMLLKLKELALEEVKKTQEMLPKLKEAGVVDAGAKGLYYFLEGFYILITNEEFLDEIKSTYYEENMKSASHKANVEEIDYENRYCTEFIVDNAKFELLDLKKKIKNMGNSLVTVQSIDKTKVHIHTNNPGKILEEALKFGELEKIKIENMVFMQENKRKKDTNNKIIYNNENKIKAKYIAVVDSQEIGKMFLEKGAAAVIIGGQSKNPSVSTIIDAIKSVGGNEIIILPNNKNIISTVNSAKNMLSENIMVLETKTVLEGYFIILNKDKDFARMMHHMRNNISIEITKALKDTNTNGLKIKENDYLLIKNGEINNNFSEKIKVEEELKKITEREDLISVRLIIGKDNEFSNIKTILSKDKDIMINEHKGDQVNYSLYMYIETKDRDVCETAIVTDSTCDLPSGLIEELPVFVVPLSVYFGGENKSYKEGVNLNQKEFWKKLLKEEQLVKTSQPAPTDFYDIYTNRNKINTDCDLFALVCLDTMKIGYVLDNDMPTTINIRADELKGSYYDEDGEIVYKKALQLKMKGLNNRTIALHLGKAESVISRYLKEDFIPFKTNARYFSDFIRTPEWISNL